MSRPKIKILDEVEGITKVCMDASVNLGCFWLRFEVQRGLVGMPCTWRVTTDGEFVAEVHRAPLNMNRQELLFLFSSASSALISKAHREIADRMDTIVHNHLLMDLVRQDKYLKQDG